MISQRVLDVLAEWKVFEPGDRELAQALAKVVEAAEKIALYPQGAHDPPPNKIEWSMAEIAQEALSELERALKEIEI